MRPAVVRISWILIALLFLTIGAAATPARAQDLRYTYIEGGWVREDLDDFESEDGWFGGGSLGFKRFHFFGEYRDTGPFEWWEAGGGWHGLFNDRFDLVAEAAYIDTEFDDGYRISGGLRWMLLEDLEINAFYNHIDAGDFENDSVSLGGLWEFAGRFAVGGEYEFGDQADVARAFFRFYFQKD